MIKLVLVLMFLLNGCMFYTVDPGNRGVLVTLGKTHDQVSGEGFGFKMPLITSVKEVSIRQSTAELKAECFSANQQNLEVDVNVMYRIPEASVLKMFLEYNGDPMDTLIAPRIYSHIKQVTSTVTVDDILKDRDTIRAKTLDLVRKDLGSLITIDDLTIKNVSLSKQLTHAIEEKMVQEQEAAKSKFIQQKAEIEARTAVITAEGAARALSIQGEAIRKNPETMQMELIKKWNGVSPMVVGSGSGTNVIMPLHNTK